MANVAWPGYVSAAGIRHDPIVTNLRLGPIIPSQSIHSDIGGRDKVFSRSDFLWQGGFTIAETDDRKLARQIELFLARLHQAEHTVRLDIDRPPMGDIPAGTALAVSAAAIADGDLVISVGGAQREGLLEGDYVQIGGRLYIVDSDMAAGSFRALPAVPPAAAAPIIWEAPYVVARLGIDDAEQFLTAKDASFTGPWSFDFREAL